MLASGGMYNLVRPIQGYVCVTEEFEPAELNRRISGASAIHEARYGLKLDFLASPVALNETVFVLFPEKISRLLPTLSLNQVLN